MGIDIINTSFSHGNLTIFKNLNLSIQKGKVTVILGPSGCGKTTLLNLISRTLKPNEGEIKTNTNINLSYLFQEPRLLPWKTVEKNILFVLDSLPEEKRKERVLHYLNELEMTQFKDYYPEQLSGGMLQRTSLARAFCFPSDTMLMDEPFKGLDLSLKLNLISSFNKLWKQEERTVLFVTHDIHEAIMLGDEIIIFTKSPVSIKKHITNPTPHNKRNLSNPDILTLEQELYGLLVNKN